MSSDDESSESSHISGNEIDDGDSERAQQLAKDNLEKLKSMSKKVNWKIKERRKKFLQELAPVIENWQVHLPDLRDVFRKEEVDRLLSDSLDFMVWNANRNPGSTFYEFLVRTGYTDEPDVDDAGKPLLRRNTPVHRVFMENIDFAHELFKIYRRYDANYVSRNGVTHFHVACKFGCVDVVAAFLELGQNPDCLEQKKRVLPPLHLALLGDEMEVVELLLRGGADPNLAGINGVTPLFIMCDRFNDYYDVEENLFKICDDMQRSVHVDTRDKLGRTALFHALLMNCKKIVESLLRRGANPNVTDENGSTPLHVLCHRDWDVDVIETLFKVNDDIQQRVLIDVQNQQGLTPLQLAMLNFLPSTVNLLLERGADLSKFVFPTISQFHGKWGVGIDDHVKLKVACSAVACVEHLEKRGYELQRDVALTIMIFFAKYKMFQRSIDLEKCWYDDAEFARDAKEIIIIPSSLTLYDLVRLRPEEASKLLTPKNYLEFEQPHKLNKLLDRYRRPCYLHMCENLWRRFFRRWALESFLELTRYRLPILCCDVIIKKLVNEDLWHISLAAACQRHEDGKKNVTSSINNTEKKITNVIKSNEGRPVRAVRAPKKLKDYVCS